MPTDADRYEAWYAEKLWRLLPEIHRAEDGEDADDFDGRGPLRELVDRIGAQVAVVRRSIDRLWEDQSIESCDDWVIDYIGDLLATNPVPGLDGRGRRADVGRTIYYRRRKGTVALLEELASDVTGWHVRVVEQFRRLGRTRHLLDPAIGLPVEADDPAGRLQQVRGLVGERTRTPAGGWADLRAVHGASLARTAFDEYSHTADVRRGRGAMGWYGIPRVGVFVWRLHSTAVVGVDAVQDATCPNQWTFDPTGRDTPLFAPGGHPLGDAWVAAREHEVPGPISAELLATAFDDLYVAGSLFVYRFVGGPPPGDFVPVPPGEVTRDPCQPVGRFFIDPVLGRLVAPIGVDDGPFLVDHHYGFTTEIGAGAYDRRERASASDPGLRPVTVVTGGTNLDAALGALGPAGAIVVDDSRTYAAVADVSGVQDVVIRSSNFRRPVIRPDADEWVFTGTGDAVLAFDGIFLSGSDIVLRGSFDRVTFRCCTLDPGAFDPAAGDFASAADDRALRPASVRVEASVRTLVMQRCILGPILDTGGLIEHLVVGDSVVHACDPAARSITMATGAADLDRCTLLGPARLRRLDASECVLADVVSVDDTQHGCVRFSAWTVGSTLPRKYQSVRLPANAGLFGSLEFGRPDYAQLLPTAGSVLLEGGEDGAELGAFARERSAVKERGLLIKYREYLPIGLEPAVVHVT